MKYKLSADSIRMCLCDFLKPEADVLWQRDFEVRVSIGTDRETGMDKFWVDVLDLIGPPEYGTDWRDATPINSIAIDLYRPAPHVQTQLREFATTVRNQLRLML